MSETISGYRGNVQTLSVSLPEVTMTTAGTVNAYGSIGSYLIDTGGGSTLIVLDAAVLAPAAGRFTIQNDGTIESAGTTSADVGVLLAAPGTLMNAGEVSAASGVAILGSMATASIQNTGLIDGTVGFGIDFSVGGKVFNSGTINGAHSFGIGLFGGGAVRTPAPGRSAARIPTGWRSAGAAAP